MLESVKNIMDELRVFIQNKLNECTLLTAGVPTPDSTVESGKTYFGYELYTSNKGGDFERNYTFEVNINGRLVRHNSIDENTVNVLDNALTELQGKLKEIGFLYNAKDVSLDDNLRKILVTGYFSYNELTKRIY